MEQIIKILLYMHGWLAGIAVMDAIIAMCAIAIVVKIYRMNWG